MHTTGPARLLFRDQWYAYAAAWAGWTLDAFDFAAFLLIIAPIAKEFDVPVSEVAFVLTVTLCMRLIGGNRQWLARRPDRPQDATNDLDRLAIPLPYRSRATLAPEKK